VTYSESRKSNRMEAREAPQTHNGVPLAGRAIDVSIVMPCLNEEEAIGRCVEEASRALVELGISGEVVVVDNGSSDRSVVMAKAAGARVIHEPDRGYGNACRRGLSEARGRYLVMGDSDGTYDFGALPAFVEPLQNGADMVVGNRLNRGMEKGAMPWLHRYVGNPVLTGIMNVLFRSDIGDAHCGLRSIRKPYLEQLDLVSPGMEFASEFLIEAVQHGARIEQVPIQYRRRSGGQPKLRTFRDGLRHLGLMLVRSRGQGHDHHRQTAPREWHAALATGTDTIVDLNLLHGSDLPAIDVVAVRSDARAHNADRVDHA
jgi:glycosyltransferase involved in cell wall biosynthesis